MGVSTASTATPATMAANIKKISGGNANVYSLGTGTSFNVTSYSGYASFTKDNFIVEPVGANVSNWYDKGDEYCKGYLNPYVNLTKSYSNGVLTAKVTGGMNVKTGDGGTLSVSASVDSSVKAYLIIYV